MVRREPPKGGTRAKRAVDLLLATPAVAVTLPVVAVLATGSLIAYRANPFFTQERTGLDGHSFRCTKIRSMSTDAPHKADRHTINLHVNGRWGRFLRASHLDELPQFWHVISGTMTLVGPRPVIPEHHDDFDDSFVEERTRVKPGLTGLWQISPYKAEAIGEHPEFDLYYLENRTLRLDVWIMARTAKFLLGGKNNVPLEGIPRWTGAAIPKVKS